MTQIIKSNTGVMHFISLGTYSGQTCDSDNFFDSDRLDEDFEQGYADYLAEEYWEHFDNKKYMAELQRLANDFIQEEIVPHVLDLDIGILGIKGVDTGSPREYNFATDELILEIEVEDNFQETVIELINNLDEKELASYEKYLKRHCTSYDGFYSFVSNKIPDIIDEIQKDVNATELDCFIDWYIEYHCDEDWDYQWTDYLHEHLFASEFLPEDFKPISRHLVNSFPDTLVNILCSELWEVGDTSDEVISKVIQRVVGDDSDHPLYFKDSEVEDYLRGKVREALVDSPMPLLNGWNLVPNNFPE